MSTYAAADVARIDAALDANSALTDAQISGMLLLDEDMVREVRESRNRAKEAAEAALVPLADALRGVDFYRHVSKTYVKKNGSTGGGNPGYYVPWTELPDGRRITVHVLDAK